jgi:rhodanese-related sulfurtransferase
MSDFKAITSKELQEKLEAGEKLHLIDVREDYEVAYGKIPGAMHIPMNTIPEQLQHLDKEKEYIIICAAGVRSEMVCRYMHEKGFKVVNMEGGMYSWEGELSVD